MGMGDVANSGMQAAMQNMDVISNNIANSGTYAFKRSTLNFTDLFPSGNNASNVQIGLGVTVSGTQQDFTAGGPTQTGYPSDFSIGGNGLFILKDPSSGGTSYSRYGRFKFDESTGYFMLGSSRVQGFSSVNGAIPSGSSPSDLLINTNLVPAVATTTVTQSQLNLNPSDKTVITTPFSPTTAGSYNYTTTATMYDSLGAPNKLELYYVKSTSTLDSWTVNAYVNGTSVGTGTMVFDVSGNLTSATGLNNLTYNPSSGAAQAQPFSISMSGATQTGTSYGATPFAVNGNGTGSYSGYIVDGDGNVTVKYSNGQEVLAGQIALATFQAPQNLQNMGDNVWGATSTSGAPFVSPLTSLANINQGNLELSNVDLATEMVNLITAQNAFQANAQVEQIYAQVMQTVTKL